MKCFEIVLWEMDKNGVRKWCPQSDFSWYVDKNGKIMMEDGDWTEATHKTRVKNQQDCQNMCEQISACIGIAFEPPDICSVCYTDELYEGSAYFYKRPGNLISVCKKGGSSLQNCLAGFYF